MRRFFSTLIVWLALVNGVPAPPAAGQASPDGPPNFLIIITDDQRFDTLDYMPRTRQLIFERGVTFKRAYVTTPLCCPSRATILTGQYTHTHRVYSNGEALRGDTMVRGLHDNGYFTGMVGKFLNSWGRLAHYDEPLPEFDYWAAHGGLGGEGDYYHPRLMVEGEWVEHDEYTTYVVRDYALDFLDEAQQRDQPFFLIFAPYAPHAPATPAPGDETLYADLAPFRPTSFDAEDVSNLPPVLRRERLSPDEIAEVDAYRLNQLRSLKAADEAIEALVMALDEAGTLDQTAIIFLSDNGVMWGEHRLAVSKDVLYEEAVHVPFALAYPPLIAGPQTRDELVANVDIAPTIYELAGLPIPAEMEGRSLVPLLAGEGGTTWRSSLLLEAYDFDGDELIYVGLRDDRYLYAETLEQVEQTLETTRLKVQAINLKTQWVELYDMQADPDQLNNLAGDPAYRQVENRLRRQLWREVSRNELSPRSDRRLGYYEWAALGGGGVLALGLVAAIILITRRVTLRQIDRSQRKP